MANKQLFKTPYGDRERYFVESGTGIEKEYGYTIDRFGRKILECKGEKNLYEEIQMALEETKIENILARAMAGDTSGLNANGTYMDTTQIPNNLIEARQAIQNLENVWLGLSQELKNKYHNSVEEFVGASGSDGWLRDMGLLTDAPMTEINESKKESDVVGALGQVGKEKEMVGGTDNE